MSPEIERPDLAKIAERTSRPESEVTEIVEMVKRAMEPQAKRIPVVEKGIRKYYAVERRGLGILNTKYGKFWEYEFTIDDNWGSYSVIVKADSIDPQTFAPKFEDRDSLVLRIDSGCKTGQVFGDLTCECDDQLDLAMQTLSEKGEGMIINIPKQDGRGMGISFKLATLWLQDSLGVDTVESASILAPEGVIDVRTYSGIIGILKFFGIPETCTISLASNNPHKAEVFAENKYVIGDFVPVVVPPTEQTERHLRAKQEHLGHIKLVNDK